MLLSINITFACITIVEFLSTDPIFDIDILVFMNESFYSFGSWYLLHDQISHWSRKQFTFLAWRLSYKVNYCIFQFIMSSPVVTYVTVFLTKPLILHTPTGLMFNVPMRNNTVQLEYLLNNKLKIRPIFIIISVKKIHSLRSK